MSSCLEHSNRSVKPKIVQLSALSVYTNISIYLYLYLYIKRHKEKVA